MKKMFLLILPLFFILTACSHVDSYLMSREMRFPKRVLVHSFDVRSGQTGGTPLSLELIKDRATKIFTEGLVQMGFEIVDPKTVYGEIKIQDINRAFYFEPFKAEENEKKSEEMRQLLADRFAIQGIFIGSINVIYFKKPPGLFTRGEYGNPPESIEEMGGKKWDCYLRISLTLIPSGYALWKCFPGSIYFFDTTWEASIERVTNEVLRHLEKDIKK